MSTVLNYNANDLTSLPKLPCFVEELHCCLNSLSFLPELPVNLNFLDCGTNSLIVLPSLPQTLNVLDCSSNPLTYLPSLPHSLTFLHCSDNQLKSLPELPHSLISLFCNDNKLIVLPELPLNLQTLHCDNNKLIKLNIDVNSALTQVYLSNNYLTRLSFSENSQREPVGRALHVFEKCKINIYTENNPFLFNIYNRQINFNITAWTNYKIIVKIEKHPKERLEESKYFCRDISWLCTKY